MKRLWALALALALPGAAAAPGFVATFHSIGLYWSPAGGSRSNAANVQFREAGSLAWRRGLDLWFDERNAEYRGSLVELKPATAYQIRLTLASGFSETLMARTWSEALRVKRTVEVAPGTTRLVIDAANSGDEKQGYVVFTAAPGRNIIDQGGVADGGRRDSCVVVRQGAHHVIIRGLVLRNCKRHGVLMERQSEPVLDVQTRNIVIEDNEIVGWGGFDSLKPGSGADTDAAIHCNYYHETDDAKRPDRIIIQRNRIRDPRHGANPWQPASGPRKHPAGPLGVNFARCGRNHVIRYNDIYSTNGNYYLDGISGGDNFSAAGFPWADSDIYGNRISHVYDDAIQAEGANRNVRIWANYLDRVFVAIANAATTTGPLYVWRNLSHRMGGMYHPAGDPDSERRGPFIKAGSSHPTANGGRAYYFHNTVLQPPGRLYPKGAGGGIINSGGALYNFVSRNNIWHIHKEPRIDGQPKFASLRADGDRGVVDANFDLYNGRIFNAGAAAERHGWRARPVYASSGGSYPDLAAQPGSFALKPGSPGHGVAEHIPNFNDRYAQPDVGAHQSGTAPMRFGAGPSRPAATEKVAQRALRLTR
jgi:hypothetical protein